MPPHFFLHMDVLMSREGRTPVETLTSNCLKF